MAENDKHNEDGEKKEDDGGVAAAVPFLFLNEAGAYIDTVLDTLKNDKPERCRPRLAGIAGTIAADNLKVANVMLYTSYPSNDSYSVAAGFENCRRTTLCARPRRSWPRPMPKNMAAAC